MLIDPRLAPSNLIKGRPLTPEEGCGHLEKIPNVRIVGGTPAERGKLTPFFSIFKYYLILSFSIYFSIIVSLHFQCMF